MEYILKTAIPPNISILVQYEDSPVLYNALGEALLTNGKILTEEPLFQTVSF